MKENKELLLAQFDEIYQIMKTSFPDVEIRSYEDQKALLKETKYQMLIKKDCGKIIALLSYWELSGCTFIEHLATTKEYRGKGYGSDLILECIQLAVSPIFLEIEPVSKHDIMTFRRAELYKRLGFYINQFPYQQPPLQQHHGAINLWLLSHSVPICEEDFYPHKKEIYANVYNFNLV